MDQIITPALPFAGLMPPVLAALPPAVGTGDEAIEAAVFAQHVMGVEQVSGPQPGGQLPVQMPLPVPPDAFVIPAPLPSGPLPLLLQKELSADTASKLLSSEPPPPWREVSMPFPQSLPPLPALTVLAEDQRSSLPQDGKAAVVPSMQIRPIPAAPAVILVADPQPDDPPEEPQPFAGIGEKPVAIELGKIQLVEDVAAKVAAPISETRDDEAHNSAGQAPPAPPHPKHATFEQPPLHKIKTAVPSMAQPPQWVESNEQTSNPLSNHIADPEKDENAKVQEPPSDSAFPVFADTLISGPGFQTQTPPNPDVADPTQQKAPKLVPLAPTRSLRTSSGPDVVSDRSTLVPVEEKIMAHPNMVGVRPDITPLALWENTASEADQPTPYPLTNALPAAPLDVARSAQVFEAKPQPIQPERVQSQLWAKKPPNAAAVAMPKPDFPLHDTNLIAPKADPDTLDLKVQNTTSVASVNEAAFQMRLETPQPLSMPNIAPSIPEAQPSHGPKPLPKEDLVQTGPTNDALPQQSAKTMPDIAAPTPRPDQVPFAIDGGDQTKLPPITHAATYLSTSAPAPSPAHQAATALVQNLTPETNRIELTLTPEDLGALRFEIHRHGDDLSIVLSAERPETLDLMRRHLPDLAAELKQAGLQGGTLSFGQWADRGHERAQTAFDTRSEAEAPSPALPPFPSRPASDRGLDLRL